MFMELFFTNGQNTFNCPIDSEETFTSILFDLHDRYRIIAASDNDGCYSYYLFDDFGICHCFACSSELFKDYIDTYF